MLVAAAWRLARRAGIDRDGVRDGLLRECWFREFDDQRLVAGVDSRNGEGQDRVARRPEKFVWIVIVVLIMGLDDKMLRRVGDDWTASESVAERHGEP